VPFLSYHYPAIPYVNLRAKKDLGFLGFNVGYAHSNAVHWTQEYDEEEGLYTKIK